MSQYCGSKQQLHILGMDYHQQTMAGLKATTFSYQYGFKDLQHQMPSLKKNALTVTVMKLSSLERGVKNPLIQMRHGVEILIWRKTKALNNNQQCQELSSIELLNYNSKAHDCNSILSQVLLTWLVFCKGFYFVSQQANLGQLRGRGHFHVSGRAIPPQKLSGVSDF